jgi:hypothetical protein
MSPAPEDVLTIWHSVFCASMSGVKTLTPWITPPLAIPDSSSER